MELFAGLILIVITGFYAGSETALYRANWVRLTNWVRAATREGMKGQSRASGARQALAALTRREVTLVTILLGTNLASVFATLLFERYFVNQFGVQWTPVAVVLVVILTLVLGDYIPKALAQAMPNRWLRGGAWLLNVSRVIFAPATGILSRVLPGSAHVDLKREEFLQVFAQREQRPLTTNMAARLFRFSRMKVFEAAIPLEQVRSVPADAGVNEVLALLKESGYSRIPVYQDRKDNIVGVAVVKDLALGKGVRIRPVARVDKETRAMAVLRRMQEAGEQLMVVMESPGRTLGIVTLEDLVEELVGEIRSED